MYLASVRMLSFAGIRKPKANLLNYKRNWLTHVTQISWNFGLKPWLYLEVLDIISALVIFLIFLGLSPTLLSWGWLFFLVAGWLPVVPKIIFILYWASLLWVKWPCLQPLNRTPLPSVGQHELWLCPRTN